jgi:hypothetical protein
MVKVLLARTRCRLDSQQTQVDFPYTNKEILLVV